jgi:hypothetical protein
LNNVGLASKGEPTLDDEDVDSEPAALEELMEFAAQSETDLVRGLGGRAGIDEKLRSRLVSAGVDALGWYVSFHQIGIQWGIYLRVSGLLTTALGRKCCKPDQQ